MGGSFLSAVSAVSGSQCAGTYPWLAVLASPAQLYQIFQSPCQRCRALPATPQ